jgi:catalase (peroxidase I)
MLVRDPELKAFVEQYAQDQNLFFDHYAVAHIKMSEFG